MLFQGRGQRLTDVTGGARVRHSARGLNASFARMEPRGSRYHVTPGSAQFGKESNSSRKADVPGSNYWRSGSGRSTTTSCPCSTERARSSSVSSRHPEEIERLKVQQAPLESAHSQALGFSFSGSSLVVPPEAGE